MADDERQEPEAVEPEAPEAETTPEAEGAPEAERAPEAEATPEPEAEVQAGPEPEAPEDPQPAEAQPASEAASAAEAQVDAEPDADAARPARKSKSKDGPKEEVVPGADLEPDLVLEERRSEGTAEEADTYASPEDDGASPTEDAASEAEPAPIEPLKLAADARYRATGKRKTAVARVILKPGSGSYTVNRRTLEEAFPRPTLQRIAQDPLKATGNDTRMDVVARIHGGGVASQASALRHGIAKALVEADPNLRGELKRRGFLTRDARVKERKKAGLKKARKRPQFSKR